MKICIKCGGNLDCGMAKLSHRVGDVLYEGTVPALVCDGRPSPNHGCDEEYISLDAYAAFERAVAREALYTNPNIDAARAFAVRACGIAARNKDEVLGGGKVCSLLVLLFLLDEPDKICEALGRLVQLREPVEVGQVRTTVVEVPI